MSDAAARKYLQAYANHKQLTLGTLERFNVTVVKENGYFKIRFPYDVGNQVAFYQLGSERFRWTHVKGGETNFFYNLKELTPNHKHVVIVEGISDTVTLWQECNSWLPILGCPNAGWRKAHNFSEALGNKHVYVIADNDEAGRSMRSYFDSLGWHVRHVYVPKSFKDIGDWYLSDPQNFNDSFSDVWEAQTALEMSV